MATKKIIIEWEYDLKKDSTAVLKSIYDHCQVVRKDAKAQLAKLGEFSLGNAEKHIEQRVMLQEIKEITTLIAQELNYRYKRDNGLLPKKKSAKKKTAKKVVAKKTATKTATKTKKK